MRRSPQVLLVLAFLALLSVVVYSLAGLSGPATALAEAEEHYQARQFNAAISVLDLLEARSVSLRRDPELRRRLLHLRYRAHRDQGNYRKALDGLEELLRASGGDDRELLLDRVWLLLLSERTDDGLAQAQSILAADETSGRAAELAGEACQALYQQELRAILVSLNRDLTAEVRNRALRAMQDYLYRPTGDPEVMGGLQRFHEIMDPRLLGQDRHDTDDLKLGAVRQRIQQALTYFRQSLELDGDPVGAFNGFAFALDRSGRLDDLIALCEIYLRRFDHYNTVEAANYVANTHLDAGRYRAVVEVADRFLAPGEWRDRLQRGQLLGGERHLLLAKTRALHALGDAAGLQRTASQANQMAAAGVPMRPEQHMILALHFDRLGDLEAAARHLKALCDALAPLGLPSEGPDLLLEAMRMRIDVAERREAARSEVEGIFSGWLSVRKEDPAPYLDFARYSMRIEEYRAAHLHAGRAYELAGQDEEALRVRAEAADRWYNQHDQGASSLLVQCLRLATNSPPDVRDPALLLPLAELALKGGHPLIAMECAERASQQFIWSRWPRMVRADAALILGDPEEAVAQLESLLEYHPGDEPALDALRVARLAAGRSTADLLAELVRFCEPDVETLVALMAKALARGDAVTAGAIAARAEDRFAGHPRLLELLVDTWVLSGDLDRTREALDRLLQVTSADTLAGAEALAQDFLLRARDTAPQDLQPEVERLAVILAAHREVLFDMATQLVALDRRAAAYRLLRVIMEQERHSAARGGELYGLAGRLALRLGLEERAVEHLAAAASFDDGDNAIGPLVLTLLKLGRLDEAAPWMAEMVVVDSVTAALALRSDRSAEAISWIRNTRLDWPLHPEANCLAVLSTPEPSPWPGLRALEVSSGAELLEVLTFLGAPEFEEHAVDLARSLRDAHPESFPAELLHLRALGQAGRLEEALRAMDRLRATHGDRLEILDQAATLALAKAALSIPLGDALVRAVITATPGISPAMIVAAIQGLANSDYASGDVESALDKLSALWRQYPSFSGAGLGEAGILLQYRRPLAALQLLSILEPTAAGGDRRQFWESWFVAAGVLAWEEGNGSVTDLARDQALRVVREEAAYGSAVHFLLLDQLQRLASGNLRGSPEDLRRHAEDLVHRHLQLYLDGGDPNVALMVRSLQWVETLEGPQAALAQTDLVLRRDASLIPVWGLRAELLERAGRPGQAAAELRRVLAHVRDRNLAWNLGRIAGQWGVVEPGDEELVRDAHAGDLSSPEARLVQGLLALRGGRYQEAESQLAGSAKRLDGAHLYFRALANLAIPGEVAGARARQLFQELLASYPDSPLSLYVESFVAQLSL